jgi:hypothetical protein
VPDIRELVGKHGNLRERSNVSYQAAPGGLPRYAVSETACARLLVAASRIAAIVRRIDDAQAAEHATVLGDATEDGTAGDARGIEMMSQSAHRADSGVACIGTPTMRPAPS